MLLGGIFSDLVDQRRARGKRYQQERLLCALLLAVFSGATSLRKMELFIGERLGQLNALFGTTWKKSPSWVGIRRFLLKLDAGRVEEVVRRHAERQVTVSPGMQFIALDGKALRGSASRVLDIRARQLVSAFTQDDLIILGYLEVDDKANEILARHVSDVAAISAIFPAARRLRQRARMHRDTIDTFVAPDAWLPEGWQPMVQAVVRVVRVVEHKRKGMTQTSEETAWWVSTVALSALQFQGGICGHWSVENQNHHVRDVVMLEDACRIRLQPGILARLRSIAQNCMRADREPCISRAIYRNTLNFDHAVYIACGGT